MDGDFTPSEPDNSEANSDFEEIKKPYKCTYSGCQAVFLRPSRLARHVRQHTGERPYRCTHEGCDKSYTNSSHLKRHTRSHTLVKETFQCQTCLLVVSTRQNLKRHYARIHQNPNRFSCAKCQKKFNDESLYLKHKSMPDCLAMFKCQTCSKQCTTVSKLKRHERTHHTGNKIYACTADDCSETFNKWSLLCAHKKSRHVTEYKCKDCDKVFTVKSHLKSHSIVHAENRTVLPCPYEKCPRFYFFQRNLEHHVRANHMGNKYRCDTCDAEFGSKHTIARHIALIHMKRKKKKRNAPRRTRQKRKDAGTTKKSALSRLVGLDLPEVIEQDLMRREGNVQESPKDEDSILCSQLLVKSIVALSESAAIDMEISSSDERESKLHHTVEEICSS